MAEPANLIPARQYARRLNIHPNTVYAWIAKGQLPAQKREGKHGAVRYYVSAQQPPPAVAAGRPCSADRSLTDELIRARIAYLEARTRAVNEQAARDRKFDEDGADDVIRVMMDDDVPAE